VKPAAAREEAGVIVGIQALRVLAASMVAFHHFQNEAVSLAATKGEAYARLEWLPWTAGVDIFFVISGFIMVHASGALFGTPGAAGQFLSRRLTRVVPLYWLATTAFLAVSLLLPSSLNRLPPDTAHIAASYLFIPMVDPEGNVAPVYSLGWTLNCEMFFYVLFALFIGLRRGQTVASVTAILLALVVFGILYQPQIAPLRLWSQPIMLDFAAGMVVGLLHAKGARLPRFAAWLLALAGLALLHLQTSFLVPSGALQAAFAQGIAAILLVAGAGLARPAAGSSVLSRLTTRLGDASYAIYLLHPFAGRLTAKVIPALRVDAAVPAFFLFAGFATLAVALAAHAFVERPATRYLRRARLWPTRSKSLV
jgi:exopolysaccharide production protein ExoZ